MTEERDDDLLGGLAYAGGAFGGTLLLSRAAQAVAARRSPALASHVGFAAAVVAALATAGASRLSGTIRARELELVSGAVLAAVLRAAQAYAPELAAVLVCDHVPAPRLSPPPSVSPSARDEDKGVGTLNIPLEDDDLDDVDLSFD